MPIVQALIGVFLQNVYLYFKCLVMGVMEDLWEDLLDETEFSLFAIHTNLEDYALAYALNKTFGLHLKRTHEDL